MQSTKARDYLLNTIAGLNEVFPATTTVSLETTIPAGTTSKTNKYISIGTISGTGLESGDSVKMQLKRIASSGTEPSNDPFVLMVGFHLRQEKLGTTAYTM